MTVTTSSQEEASSDTADKKGDHAVISIIDRAIAKNLRPIRLKKRLLF